MAHIPNAERRRQFVQAAAQVIRERGIGEATTRRIAEAAGAPLSSLHYSFTGKDELYEAVMQAMGIEGRQRISDSVSPGMGVARAAEAILEVSFAWVNETYVDQLAQYEVYIWAIRSKNYKQIAPKSFQEWIDVVVDLLKSARRRDEPKYDMNALARMLLALIDGYTVQDQFLGEQRITEQSDLAIRVVKRGIESGDFAPRRRRNSLNR